MTEGLRSFFSTCKLDLNQALTVFGTKTLKTLVSQTKDGIESNTKPDPHRSTEEKAASHLYFKRLLATSRRELKAILPRKGVPSVNLKLGYFDDGLASGWIVNRAPRY